MVYDVVIAGAGPVGLFLACELRLAGVTVLVLERMEDPRSPLKGSALGMRGMNLPSVEAFYRRGLLKAVRETSIGWVDGRSNQGMVKEKQPNNTPTPRFAGHFAGIVIDANKVDFSSDTFLVGGPSAAGGLVTLEGIETLLAQRAKELGVELRRGAEVTDLSQTEDGVAVHVGAEIVHAQWLVGCDGGRSTVRKRAGFEFVGTDPEVTGYSAVVDIADPEKLPSGWNLTNTGMYVNGAPLPGRLGVVDFDGGTADRTQAVTLEGLQKTLRHVSGTDVTLTAVHVATSYTDNARQATTYRKGRVLLAGDAAHVHSPFGGQGMNLGIGDAMNLGWKLAATVKGWAPEELLDSYTFERHPIGAWALEWTRAQVAVMRPEPHAHAIAKIVRELIDTPAGATYFAQKVAGVWLRYDLPGDHPLIGRSAPDLEFEDGTRLGDLLHDGVAVLLDLEDNERLRALSAPWTGRLKYVSAAAKQKLGLTALLVRPDGFVVWVAEDDQHLIAATESLTRWFGKADARERETEADSGSLSS
jgi:2-polyprenyl-6-methoxyphenol hydroxylase-like FAD-dependent oxidoreductase